MPRNGSGTYTVPVVMTPGTQARAEDVNFDFTDAGNEITNSLPRDGQAGMTGQFKASDGTIGVPGISYSNEPSSGWRRASAGQHNLTIQGQDVLQVNATTGLSMFGGLVNPVGSIIMYGAVTAPLGWLVCDGQVQLRATYPALFAVIGTTFNTGGELGTQFRIPYFSGRVPAAPDNGQSVLTTFSAVMGARGGAQTVTLDATMIPAHTHTFSATTGTESVDHTHTFSVTSGIESITHTHFSGVITTGAQSADHTHSGTTSTESADHTHSGTTAAESATHTHASGTITTAGSGNLTPSGTVAITEGGGGLGHAHTINVTSGTTFAGGGGLTAVQSIATTGGGTNVNTTTNTTGNTAAFTGTAGMDHTHDFSFNSGTESAVHTHTITTGGISANHTHTVTTGGVSVGHTHDFSFNSGTESAVHTHAVSGTTAGISANHTHSVSGTTSSIGGGLAHANVQPTMIVQFIIRAY